MSTTQQESHDAFMRFVRFCNDAKEANTNGYGNGLLKLFISYKRSLKSTNDARTFSEVILPFAEQIEQLFASATDPTHAGNHIPNDCPQPELIGKSFPMAVKYLTGGDRSPTAVLKAIKQNPTIGTVDRLKVAV